jgi:glutathione S-transferase
MTKQITLFHAPRSRSLTVYFMLEELGVPYELKILNLAKGEHKKPDYLAINPMGKVPTIKIGEEIVFETPAICCYLAELFPERNLSFSIDSGRRGEYLKWLFFTSACLEPAVIDYILKRDNPDPSSIGYGTLGKTISTIEKSLKNAPWIMGNTFSAADVVLGSAVFWAKMVGAIKKDSILDAYAIRIAERETHKRTVSVDNELYEQNQKQLER